MFKATVFQATLQCLINLSTHVSDWALTHSQFKSQFTTHY